VIHHLDIGQLTVRYGRAVAVDGVSVRVPGGAVTCLVGPNGAGKSRIILAAYGAVGANGSVELDGEQIAGTASVVRARNGLAIVPQGRQLFPRLTVRENLAVYADMLKLPSAAVDGALDRFPILRERSRRLAGILSGGEQQMLVVSRALMTEPRAILLDEIMTGLAPRIVESLVDVVRDLSASGIAVLMAEPSIHAVRGVLDRGYVMIRGRIVDVGEDGGLDLDERYQRAMGVAQRVPAEAS
jgi:branched-chain amino acid transport system ATP-binding protein